MELRIDMEGIIYATNLKKYGNNISVGAIVKKYGPEAIRYDWLPEITYQTLNMSELEASLKRADLINDAKMKGQELTQENDTTIRTRKSKRMLGNINCYIATCSELPASEVKCCVIGC